MCDIFVRTYQLVKNLFQKTHSFPFLVLLGLSVLLSACSTPEIKTEAVKEICTGTKRPYDIKGITYTPQDHYDYEEEGIASWYGPNFHGKPGSCGSKFDMYADTAAHKTLPIPSVVEVTNVKNGRQVTLVVNDRGPFVGDRIIDLSKKAATDLGTHGAGLGTVRVKVLKEASQALANYLKQYGRYGIDPSGRPWDVIYREEIAGKVSEKPHLLVDTHATPPSDSYDTQDIIDAMERASHEKAFDSSEQDENRALPPVHSISTPGQATPSHSQSPVQNVSYEQSSPSGNAEDLNIILEELNDHSHVSSSVMKPKNTGPKSSGHFVQVGSFVNKNNATKLVKNLSSHGKATVVQQTPHFYTVQLGPYASPQQAQKVKSTVINKGHHGVQILSK